MTAALLVLLGLGLGALAVAGIAMGPDETIWSARRPVKHRYLPAHAVPTMSPYRCPYCRDPLPTLMSVCARPACLSRDLDEEARFELAAGL